MKNVPKNSLGKISKVSTYVCWFVCILCMTAVNLHFYPICKAADKVISSYPPYRSDVEYFKAQIEHNRTTNQPGFKPVNIKASEIDTKSEDDRDQNMLDHLPGSIDLSSFIGGIYEDRITDIIVDSFGNFYVAGQTSSGDLSVTPIAYDTTYNDTPNPMIEEDHGDAFIAKFDADGQLLFLTYLGGNMLDSINGITIGPDSKIYVVGATWSTNFPTTPNAYRRTLNYQRDAFLAVLSADGSQLLYSTYFGGSFWDYGHSVALDHNGDIVIGGFTHSSDLPTSPAVVQPNLNGPGDAFYCKFSGTDYSLLWCTYQGTYGYNGDHDIAIGPTNNIYVCTGYGIAQITPDGQSYVYNISVGDSYGNGYDYFGVAVDNQGYAYVVGVCSGSVPFQTTPGAFQENYGGGAFDLIVVKYDQNGDVVKATYLGGAGKDVAAYYHGITLDEYNNAYISGRTESLNFPLKNPVISSYQGFNDGVLCVLSSDLSTLLFSTYWGGSGRENINEADLAGNCSLGGIALDSQGNIYYASFTNSALDFPITPDAFQPIYGGGVSDAYFTKFTRLYDGIWIEDATGKNSTYVDIDINITNFLTSIQSFTLKLTYDSTLLQFDSCSIGDLSPIWTEFNGQVTANNEITIAGYCYDNLIETGNTGSLATLRFFVSCPSCCRSTKSELGIKALYDDISEFETQNGTFTLTISDGDVTNDGMVTAEDALYSFWIPLAMYDPDFMEYFASDCNGDGEVTVSDAQCIFMTIFGACSCVDTINPECHENPIDTSENSARFQPALIDQENPPSSNPRFDPNKGALWIDAQPELNRDTMIFDVMMTNPADAIAVFTLTLQFNNTLFAYDKFLTGDLNPGWTMIDCKETAPGVLTLGGLSIDSAIPAGSLGSLVRIAFTLKQDTRLDSPASHLNILDAFDDLKEFTR